MFALAITNRSVTQHLLGSGLTFYLMLFSGTSAGSSNSLTNPSSSQPTPELTSHDAYSEFEQPPPARQVFFQNSNWHLQLQLMQRSFPSPGLEQQAQWHSAAGLQLEWIWTSDDQRHLLVASPYLRADQRDAERSLAEFSEAYWLYYGRDWELKAGIGKIFWGAVESQRLVDIVNQRDLLARPDGEVKRGQPLVQLSVIGEIGTLQGYLLPYFIERDFAGREGRLRLPIMVDTNSPLYEASQERLHPDWALRWVQQFDSLDLSLSYFQGTSREPMLLPSADNRLKPYYPQLKQVGLDAQWAMNSWLWKLEAVHRDSLDLHYFAATAGFEYTQADFFDRPWSLGWLLEYQYDERGTNATSSAQNDLYVGWRLTFNDAADTSVLVGVIQDLDRHQSRSGRLEASTRLSEHWSFRLDGWFFHSHYSDDLLYWLRDDDYLELTLTYYF